ncbi:MAG: translation initiation factor IF-6 [Candidatus Asgardarchaeia archaeon]
MSILRFGFGDVPYIGAYMKATDKFALVPDTLSKNDIEAVEEALGVPVHVVSVGGSMLIGVFLCANSNGVIMPYFSTDREVKKIEEEVGVNVYRMKSQFTSFGNLILVNDRFAVCSPSIEKELLPEIGETLGVKVEQRKIASMDLVGTTTVATNRGGLTHPMTSDEDMKWLESVLKVPIQRGTVNLGSPYIGIGLVANSRGALVGFQTTGPEIIRISEALRIE